MKAMQPDTDQHSIPSLTVPGPKPLPLLGASANVYRFVRDPIGYTGQLFERYGPIAALSYGKKTAPEEALTGMETIERKAGFIP